MASKKDEQKLLEWFRRLPKEQARSLLDYAHFLNEQHGAHPGSLTIQDIPRPADETVMTAIKRLRSTYPMLDPARLLTETSELMSQHLTQGRDSSEIINDLEKVFRTHYEIFSKEQEAS